MVISSRFNTLVKTSLVNCAPWLLLKISGLDSIYRSKKTSVKAGAQEPGSEPDSVPGRWRPAGHRHLFGVDNAAP